MACETIVVETQTNDVCGGEYNQKSDGTLVWVNTEDSSCEITKIFNTSIGDWQWVFQKVFDDENDIPAGAEKAAVTFAPQKLKFTSEVRMTSRLSYEECDLEERLLGRNEITYELKQATSSTHPGRLQIYSIEDGPAMSRNWTCNYGTAEYTETESDGYGSTLVSPVGSGFGHNRTTASRPYWYVKHKAGIYSPQEEQIISTCLTSQTGSYEMTENVGYSRYQAGVLIYDPDAKVNIDWSIEAGPQAQFLFTRDGDNSFYWNLVDELHDNPTAYPCWRPCWYFETNIVTNTDEDSQCPSDADWSGTGVTVKTTPSGGPSDIEVEIVDTGPSGGPSGGPSDIEVEIVNTGPSGGPSDVQAEEEDIPCTETAIEVDGYCPLYTTENCANLNGDGTSHTHVLNGVTYYMPNGVEMFHGDCPSSIPNPPEEAPEQFATTIVDPVSGAFNFSAELVSDEIFTGSTIPEKYQGYVWNQRTSTLSGPFTSKGITAVTTRDNSSEMFAVDREQVVVKTVLTDLNDPMFEPFTDPFTRLDEPFVNERGVVVSQIGKGYLYDHKFKPSAFEEVTYGEGTVEKPLFFRDSYLAIAETNWMYFGDEHSEKQIHRVDLRFHKNSCGHLSLFVQSEDGKTKGQYKGPIKEHMKVFTNLRGRGFKICMLVATHENYPWAMREMAVGYLVGKSF